MRHQRPGCVVAGGGTENGRRISAARRVLTQVVIPYLSTRTLSEIDSPPAVIRMK